MYVQREREREKEIDTDGGKENRRKLSKTFSLLYNLFFSHSVLESYFMDLLFNLKMQMK